MAKARADILVEVGGDVTPLTRALRSGGRHLDTFAAKGAHVGRRMARVGAAMAAALTLGTTAASGLARRAADAAVEIDNLARLAGASPVEFQRMAAAAETVGIKHEKLADILKDVQDRVGDFISTGGGPMADFFENIAPAVGVTAEQFQRLSGPDALQLFISSLEKANLTQSEMTFYLEAMASDMTALLPLLKNGGAEMKRLGDKAEDAGRVLSGETLEGARKLKEKLDELEGSIRAELTTAMIGLEDELEVLAIFVRDYGVPALESLIEWGAKAAGAFTEIAEAIAIVRGNATALGDDVAAAIGSQYGIDSGTGGAVTDPVAEAVANDPDAFSGGASDPLKVTVGGNAKPRRQGLDGDTSGGGRRGPTRDDLEALQDALATENELLQKDYEQKLSDLAAFREQKLGSEEEFNDLEERIHREHTEKLIELERLRKEARLSAVSGAFSDLASLMNTESKGLFKIGKIAAISEASVSGYLAAVEAWEKGMKIGGPPLAAAFASASALKTAGLIAQIKSTNFGSSGGAAPGAGGGNAAPPVAADPAQHINLTIGGGDFFPRSSVESLAEELLEHSRRGARVTVNGR